MKNKFLFVPILIILGLASCNPNFNDSSSVDSSSKDDPSSAEPSSSSSESGTTSEDTSGESGSTTSEEPEGHTHEAESAWTYNDDKHWHECVAHDGYKFEEGVHQYEISYQGDPSISTYFRYKKVYTCVCGKSYSEDIYYSKQEMCDLMNDELGNETFFDIYEAREKLVANGYPIIDSLESDEYYGYDTSIKKVAIIKNSNVNYPSGASLQNFVSFREKSVSSLAGLKTEIANVSNNNKDYSVIKLTNNISTSEYITINSDKHIALDMNGKTISGLRTSGPVVRVYKASDVGPTFTLFNGTIQTPIQEGYDLSNSPSCIYVADAETVRLTNVTLNNRSERGYGYIDNALGSSSFNLKINDSTVNSKIVAICIQRNNNILTNNTINGVVVINGGDTRITNNTIDVSNIVNDANRLITCEELEEDCYDCFVTANKDTYMMTSTDPILIYDRRSSHSTYDSPSAFIENNTLTCLGTNDNPYGYGIRYMDLDFDPNKPENNKDHIVIEDNTYTKLRTGASTPRQMEGGYYFFYDN